MRVRLIGQQSVHSASVNVHQIFFKKMYSSQNTIRGLQLFSLIVCHFAEKSKPKLTIINKDGCEDY